MMKGFKSLFFSYVLPLIGVLIVVFSCEQSGTKNMQVCDHPYALCTSAKCIPQPGDPLRAICTCDVEHGKSLSTALCNTIQPTTDANGILTVYSTFSLEQFYQGLKGMKCPAGTPWTWCLNKRCTVDPTNPEKAICTCDIMRNTKEWMTLGGDCDTATCMAGYWSGATLEELDESGAFLKEALGLDELPLKWCPAVSP